MLRSFVFSLFCLPGLSFGAIEAGPACRVSLVDTLPSGLVCRKNGSVDNLGQLSLVRLVYAESLAECERICFQDLSCNTLRYFAPKGSCSTYQNRIRTGHFTGNPASEFVFSSYDCYQRDGRCPVLNPTFDDASIDGGSVSPRPTGFRNGLQQVFLSPWSTLSFGGSFARLVTPDNRTPNLPEPVNSGEPNYALMNVAQTDEISLLQSIRLRPNYWHRASLSYNLISYDGQPSSPGVDNTYRIVLVRDDDEDVTTLEPDTTVLGSWVDSAPSSFKSAADAADTQFGVRIEPPQGQDIANSAVFGLDNVIVEACPSNHPC